MVEVKVFDDDLSAIRYGMGIEDGGGSVAGVQFPDGRYIDRDEWTAFRDEERRRIAAWRDVEVKPPAPYRRVTVPWGDDIVGIDADLPDWVGLSNIATQPDDPCND